MRKTDVEALNQMGTGPCEGGGWFSGGGLAERRGSAQEGCSSLDPRRWHFPAVGSVGLEELGCF